jgi:ComF family protein
MPDILSAAIDIVYPRSCAACRSPVGTAPGLVCWDCVADFHYVTQPFCNICGDPVDGLIDQKYTCSYCVKKPPHFHRARSAVRYGGSASVLMQAFKYQDLTALTANFVPLLVACLKAHYSAVRFDAVACVPLNRAKERKRTYNQSHLLAKSLAREFQVSFLSGCLQRTRATATQTGLAAGARQRNVHGAFRVAPRYSDWIEGRTMLLVDDVMTTGATVNECARILKQAGSPAVYVITVARG